MTEKSFLCNYIKTHENWREELPNAPYFISIKETDGLAIFNYSLISSETVELENGEEDILRIDFTIPEVQEARGIIIDPNTCEVVCWPFRKFGNYGESYVDDIDWKTARVQEKIDGSIMKLWFDKRENRNTWRISTNAMIDAFEAKTPSGKNFGELFLDGLEKTKLKNSFSNMTKDKLYTNVLDKDNTYIFELTSPVTRVVIDYNSTEISHIGTRNNITGQELNVDINVKKPKEYSISTIEDCIKAAEKLNDKLDEKGFLIIDHEGFVVVDDNWNRIKIKSPDYVRIHHAFVNGVISNKTILQLIKDNEIEEYITYFPSYKEIIDEYREKYDRLYKNIDEYCKKAKILFDKLNDRKQFALTIKNDKFAYFAFFHLFHEKTTNEIINDLRMKQLLNLVDDMENFDLYKANPSLSIVENSLSMPKNDEIDR